MYNSNKSENFDDLQGVFSVSYIESEKVARETFHIHDAYEIMLVVSDDVSVEVNDESYPVPFGSVLLFNTLDLHRIIYSGKELYKRHVIWFKHDFLNEIEPLRHMLLRCYYVRGFDKANLLIMDDCGYKRILELFDRLAQTDANDDDTKNILRKLILGEILVLINELYFSDSSFSKISDSRNIGSIYNAIQFIQENYFDAISQEQLAKLAYTNKRTLNENFLKVTGKTTGQYILNCRITAAKAFLVRGMPVSEVCERTGFGNLSNFSRTFKKHMGLSPKQYATYHRKSL